MLFIILLILCLIPICYSEAWSVYVHTGRENFAGTDSDVYIRLTDVDGLSTSEYPLSHFNFIPEQHQFPIRNLFEIGAKEKFTIFPETIGDLVTVHIRHNNIPPIQSDWFLERVILMRHRDGKKYTFECKCWLRKEKPYATITILPDQTNKKQIYQSASSKSHLILVIILGSLIITMVCIFCCVNEHRRRQRYRSLPIFNVFDHLHDTTHQQTVTTTNPEGNDAHYWMETLRRWKHPRNAPPSYNQVQTTQSTTNPETNPSDAPPPSYEDLYPNAPVPQTTVPNTIV